MTATSQNIGVVQDSCLGKVAVALVPAAFGDFVCSVMGPLADSPSTYSMQVGPSLYVTSDGLDPSDAINHSCQPNLELDVATWCLRARRQICAGEPLTYNYLTTEWELAAPFHCLCGSARCFGWIAGYRYLAPSEREDLEGKVGPWLLDLLGEQGAVIRFGS
jgi:hypothetical protein